VPACPSAKALSLDTNCRCYFIQADRIVGHEDVFSADDDSAIEKARELLNAGTLRKIELWRGKERVAVLEKDDS
jgi:hypothetical protein